MPSSDGGRVEAGGASGAALYVTGWLKRGPSGVILTNVTDAEQTAGAVLADIGSGALASKGGGGAAVRELLSAQSAPVVDFAAWSRIDAAEVEAGGRADKVREKLVTIESMLEAAKA